MRRILYLLLSVLLFSNCTHYIARTGYQPNKSFDTYYDVVIEKNTIVPSNSADLVGQIRLDDIGFSVSCSEEDALEILRKEACSINADLIVITNEIRPNLWSSCYRCSAEFYKYRKEKLNLTGQTENPYKDELVSRRVQKDKNQNTAVLLGSLAFGFIIGFLLVM